MRRWLIGAVLLSGCVTYQSLSPRQPQLAFSDTPQNVRVYVFVEEGDMGPYCSLRDAADQINCHFTLGWLNGAGVFGEGSGGYKHMSAPGARKACGQAMWGAVFNGYEREACAQALLYFRFALDGDGDGQPGEPEPGAKH